MLARPVQLLTGPSNFQEYPYRFSPVINTSLACLVERHIYFLNIFALACLMLEGFGVSYILFKHRTLTSLMFGVYGMSHILVKHLVFTCLVLEGWGISYILRKPLTLTSLRLGDYRPSYTLLKHLSFNALCVRIVDSHIYFLGISSL